MIKIIISVIALLLIAFIISKKTNYFLVTPQFAFVVSFIPSLVMLSLFIDKWTINLDNRTILLIILGAVVFTAVSFSSEKIIQAARAIRFSGINRNTFGIILGEPLISDITLVFFIAAGFIGVAFYLYYVSSFTGAFSISNLSLILMNYRDAYNTENLDMPAVVSVLSMFATCIADYCVYYFFKNRKMLKRFGFKRFLLFLCCIPGVVIPFLSGARGGIINFGMFVFAAVMVNSTREIKIQNKTIRVAIILAVAAIATLRVSAIFMGRNIDVDAIDYIGMYLPAPIRNLDYIIRTEEIGMFSGFGDSANRTFAKLLSFLSFRFGFDFSQATEVRRTLMVNGYFTGNMYTVYYNLLHDAGFVGSLLLLAVTAFLCQIFFVAVKIKIEGREARYTGGIAYTLVYSYLFLSFFNENFFYNVFTNYFLRQIIFFMLIDWFVRKTKVTSKYLEGNQAILNVLVKAGLCKYQ